jgi:hypothetical protein
MLGHIYKAADARHLAENFEFYELQLPDLKAGS